MSSARRCSQCGQEGHNRRNHNCPENMRMRAEADEANARLQEGFESNALAHLQVIIIQESLEKWEQRRVSTTVFIRDVLVNIHLACHHISISTREDISVAGFFAEFERLVEVVNRIIRRHTSSRRMVVTNFTATGGIAAELVDRPHPIIIEDSDEENEENEEPVKRTSVYLKKVSLVYVLTVSEDAPGCECPLCFDEVPAQNVVLTGCKHAYCGTCIKNLATSIKDKTVKPTCSMCRAEITELTFGKQEIYTEIDQFLTNL